MTGERGVAALFHAARAEAAWRLRHASSLRRRRGACATPPRWGRGLSPWRQATSGGGQLLGSQPFSTQDAPLCCTRRRTCSHDLASSSLSPSLPPSRPRAHHVRRHARHIDTSIGKCDPRVFCASKLPIFLARWRVRVRGRPAVRGPTGTGLVGDGGSVGEGERASAKSEGVEMVHLYAASGRGRSGDRSGWEHRQHRQRAGEKESQPGEECRTVIRQGEMHMTLLRKKTVSLLPMLPPCHHAGKGCRATVWSILVA